jgi:hypothetical protein
MTQKKKLILNPLPEQTEDYSRYEEVETRWDRIISVFVILALLIGILTYFLLDNEEESESNALNTPLSEEQLSVLKTEEKTSSLIENKENTFDVRKQETEQVLASSQSSPELEPEQTRISESKLNEGASQKTVKEQIKDAVTEELRASVVAENIAEETSVSKQLETRSAQVSIENNAITRAVLTLVLKDKEPLGTIPYELVLPEEGIVKVILFNEMNGLRGKKLYHEWYRNGVRQARVRIPVNVNKQRSHSSKYINAQMLGDWHVKVVDGAQKLYVSADFKVVLP